MSIETDPPPSKGDIAQLTIDIYFDVNITNIDDDKYEGEVIVIDSPAIVSKGIKRGDVVSFSKRHKSALKRT